LAHLEGLRTAMPSIAGVAGLLGIEHALGLDQRVVRRQADRLVAQQHAVDQVARLLI
jgi:hypothetical protein